MIVIDNASSDSAVDGMPRVATPVHLVRNTTNDGFARACNQGARAAVADYLLFINPDVVVAADAVDAAVDALEASSASHAIAGIQLVDEHGEPSRVAGRAPSLRHLLNGLFGLHRFSPLWFPCPRLEEWDHRRSRDVDYVSGAFFLVRRTVFAALGGFDERFVLYLEDLDFCIRAREAGWRTRYVAGGRAYHRSGWHHGPGRGHRVLQAWRSQIAYAAKHLGSWQARTLRVATYVLAPPLRIVHDLLTGHVTHAREALRAARRLWV